MSDTKPTQSDLAGLPEAVVERRTKFPLVWLIPLIAAIIGIWLAYKTITAMGPTITISFKNGEGLEAGKTKVKYNAVEVGLVETVEISEDLSRVIVTAKMTKGSKSHLREKTRFWVVRPRIGLAGVSGLQTLISGPYIGVDPGPGALSMNFVGLETPPGVTAFEEGRQFRLQSPTLGFLKVGTPVYFRDIEVGRILSHELADDSQSVFLNIFVHAPHHLRVRSTSRFWKTSGFEVSLGAKGLDVKLDSVASFIAGGVAFDTPVTAAGGATPSQEGTVFELYESFDSIGESVYTQKVPYLLHFDGSVRGLATGAPVEFRGIKVGSVTDIAVVIDEKALDVSIPVAIEIEPQRVSTTLHEARRNDYQTISLLVKRGLRAQLQTASLLTGQLFVQLEFFEDLPKKKLIMTGKYPEIPTVPSTMDQLQNTVNDVLADVKTLPLDKIADEVLSTMKGVNRFANSPELLTSVRQLTATLHDVRRLTRDMDRAIVDAADPDAPTMVNLANMLEELSDAARSIRVFAEYLERHPEALVRGKSE
ncbi:MAG: MlaD family protein [Nitrospirales bacterium]|nr:MCE family protein [Nitrospira sp.]MDR4501314.1 MlaD family protein [Nitrospirales bacterium]